MTLFLTFRVAIKALGRNKLRTTLTMLGIIIGVAAVVAMLSIGSGAQAAVTQNLSELGVNTLEVYPGFRRGRHRGASGSERKLVVADWKAISTVAEAGMLEDLWSAKSTHTSHPRRLQEVVQETFETLIPNAQRVLIKRTRNDDPWAKLYVKMREIYGHRCNSTHGCDRVRGTCLNITGLPIIGYDQNGTCTCHPYPSRLDDFEGSELQAIVHGLRPPSSRWFTGDECEGEM